jgi:hypothetical protein
LVKPAGTRVARARRVHGLTAALFRFAALLFALTEYDINYYLRLCPACRAGIGRVIAVTLRGATRLFTGWFCRRWCCWDVRPSNALRVMNGQMAMPRVADCDCRLGLQHLSALASTAVVALHASSSRATDSLSWC